MPLAIVGDDRYETGCDFLDATSNHRPDTTWVYVDRLGHEHRWQVNGQPAGRYSAHLRYSVPTLVWVKDGVDYYDDGEAYEIGHSECRSCGEHVEPTYTADTTTQLVPGLRWCKINGDYVSLDEFKRRYFEATGEQL